jgi:hypothetical protein
MPFPSHPPSFDNSNKIFGGVHVMKLLLMQFSPASYYFFPLKSKYPPWQIVLKHPQTMFFP